MLEKDGWDILLPHHKEFFEAMPELLEWVRERGLKKTEVSFGILVKIHKINDVESPAGRWRTEETGSRQDGTAGDMMSCYWLSDSRSYRLLSHTPGCGTAVVRSSRSCKVGWPWSACVHLSSLRRREKKRWQHFIMGGVSPRTSFKGNVLILSCLVPAWSCVFHWWCYGIIITFE